MKNKSELQHEVVEAGICIDPRSGKYTKEMLMDMLATLYRKQDVQRPPLLPQLPVMLARKVKDLHENELDAILDSPKGAWIAEEKLDGVRAKLHLESTSNRIDSRHRSDVTYEYVEKTNGLPHLRNIRHYIPGTVLDGELLMPASKITDGKTVTDSVLTSTTATINSLPGRAIELQERFGYCQFYAFDILFHCGRDVRQLPYSFRYKLLCGVHIALTSYLCFRLPTHRDKKFIDFYHHIIKRGGEGIMLKRLDWPYEGSKRSKGMYKLKKEEEIDCFITGFVPGEGEFSGLVGSLLVSVFEDDRSLQKQEIAAVQPGDLGFRNKISLADGSLCEDMYGKVVEVSYLCKTKNDRLRHAVLERFRPDKNMYDCKEQLR